jgi:hypothetical protein
VDNETLHLPALLSRFSDLLDDQVSSSKSLKEHLARINFPKLALLYPSLKSELLNLQPTSSSFVGIQQTQPISTDYEKDLNNLFQEFSKSSAGQLLHMYLFYILLFFLLDPLVGLCKLADYCYRFDRASNLDNDRIERFLEREKQRSIRNDESLTITKERASILEGKDESALIKKSEVVINKELRQLKEEVILAQKQEEEAFRAYEEAKRRKRMIEENLQDVETSLDFFKAQTDLLKQIDEIKIVINRYNYESAEQRLTLLKSLQSNLSEAQTAFLEEHIFQELPVILNYMSDIVMNLVNNQDTVLSTSSSSNHLEGKSQSQLSSLHSLRICQEAIKLFRRLTINSSFQPFLQKLLELEKNIIQLEENLLSNEKIPRLTPPVTAPNYQNSTVILYFTHVLHDTPTNHVEDQQRVDKAIKVLMKLKANSLTLTATSSSTGSNVHSLIFEKCENIKSPPFWCLPLVHSSHYLKRLQDYEIEAKTDDLYVPLEFDTEWESEYAFTSESDSEEVTRRAKQYFNFEIDENLTKILGDQDSKKLFNVLKPQRGDFAIANSLNKNRVGGRPRRRRRTGNGVELIVDKEEEPVKKSGEIERIRCLYGNGKVLEVLENGMIKASLEWGATAFLNKDSYKLIKPEPPLTDVSAPPSVIPVVAPHAMKPEDRFLHTDLRLHKILTRVIAQVRAQRSLIEKIDVKDAHLSLWLHGRTSSGLSKNIESSLYGWLTQYDRAKLEDLLTSREARSDLSNDDNDFLKELEQFKLPRPVYSSVDYFGDEPYNKKTLRDEAFEYSVKRLINKSGLPRANGPRIRGKNASKPDRRGRKPVNSVPVTAEDGTTTTSQIPAAVVDGDGRRNKRKELRYFPSEFEFKKTELLLQQLLNVLMRAMNITQTEIADEFWKKFEVKTTQTSVSAWFHQRASNDLGMRMTAMAFLWIESNQDELPANEFQQFRELAAQPYFKLLSENQGLPTNFGGKPSPRVKMESSPAKKPITTANPPFQHKLLSLSQPIKVPVVKEEEPSSPPSPTSELESVTSKEEEQDEPMEVDKEVGEVTAEKAKSGDKKSEKGEQLNEIKDGALDQEEKMSVESASLASENEKEENEENDDADKEEDNEDDDEEEEGDPSTKKRRGRPPKKKIQILYSKRSYVQDMRNKTELSDSNNTLLLNDFIDEMDRRSLTHIYVAREASRLALNLLSQPIISKFVRLRTNPYLLKGNEFSYQVTR